MTDISNEAANNAARSRRRWRWACGLMMVAAATCVIEFAAHKESQKERAHQEAVERGISAAMSVSTLNGYVNLGDPQITNAGMTHLKGLANLRSLLFGKSQITDDGLVHLADWPKLVGVDLSGTQITDAGLVYLQDLTNMKSLNLDHTTISDEGLVHLQAMTNMSRLDLNGTAVTDAGLGHLEGMSTLNSLSLHDTQVTSAGAIGLKTTLPRVNIRR